MTGDRVPAPYLSLLACPVCRREVEAGNDGLRCAGCGLTFPVTDGIPEMFPPDALDPAFKATLERWNAEWRRQGLPPDGDIEADPAYAQALAHIRARAPKGDWGVFLEAGCGSGKNSLVVARERHVPVVGVDACREACRLARQLLAREGQTGLFVVGDLRRLPFKDGVFGYIYAGGSYEHFTDTASAVQEAWRVLRPGGRVNAAVPVISLATLTYRQLWGNIPELPLLRPLAEWVHLKLLRGRHLRFGYEKSFLPGTFRGYFRRAGFKRVVSGYLDAYLDLTFMPWAWLKQWARWLARRRLFWPMIFVDAEK